MQDTRFQSCRYVSVFNNTVYIYVLKSKIAIPHRPALIDMRPNDAKDKISQVDLKLWPSTFLFFRPLTLSYDQKLVPPG